MVSNLLLLPLTVAAVWVASAAEAAADSGYGQEEARLGTSPVLDLDSVYSGTWDPNNIAIHVSQNAVNFFTSTAFWGLASFFYQAPSKKRSLYQTPWADNSVFYKKRSVNDDVQESSSKGVKISGKKIAAMLRTFAETAESLDK